MNETQRAKIAFKILNKIYPKIEVPLKSRNIFTLLISVLLSAQCTDVNVNNVTKNIYPKYYKPQHFKKLGIETNISNANFLLVNFDKTKIGAKNFFLKLAKAGILVRRMNVYNIKNSLRITIGNNAENKKFIKILRKII